MKSPHICYIYFKFCFYYENIGVLGNSIQHNKISMILSILLSYVTAIEHLSVANEV